MKETNCKNCGAPLHYDKDEYGEVVKCNYCKTEYHIDLPKETISNIYVDDELIIEIGERLA